MAKVKKTATHGAAPLTISRPELLLQGSDQAFRQFVHDTLAFAARVQAVRNSFGAAIGLSGSQYTVLIAIARDQHKLGVGVNHVAEQLHLSPAFVTIEVNKLVAAKLISKKQNPDDRRRVLLTTTAKAAALLRRLTELQRPVNDMLFENITAAEFDQLRGRMPNLVDCADRALRLSNFLSNRARARS